MLPKRFLIKLTFTKTIFLCVLNEDPKAKYKYTLSSILGD